MIEWAHEMRLSNFFYEPSPLHLFFPYPPPRPQPTSVPLSPLAVLIVVFFFFCPSFRVPPSIHPEPVPSSFCSAPHSLSRPPLQASAVATTDGLSNFSLYFTSFFDAKRFHCLFFFFIHSSPCALYTYCVCEQLFPFMTNTLI